MGYLKGKTIEKMMITEDKKALLFVTGGENIIVKTDGGCCSSTWIENIEFPAMGFPAKVIKDNEIDMPDLEQENEFITEDEDKEAFLLSMLGDVKYYGYKITTDKGDIIIDYRNKSNGYYGGNLSWPDDEYFYRSIYGQNVSEEKWVEINKDI